MKRIMWACMLLLGLRAGVIAAQETEAIPAPRDLWAAQTSAGHMTLSWFAPSLPPKTNLWYVVICEESGRMRRGVVTAPLIPAPGTTGRLLLHVMPVGKEVPHTCRLELSDAKGNVVSQTPFNTITPMRTKQAKPTAPTAVTVVATDTGTIIISWSPVPEATAYRIVRSSAEGVQLTLCHLCPTSGTYTDKTVTTGTAVWYTLVAIGPGGVSDRVRSNEIVVR